MKKCTILFPVLLLQVGLVFSQENIPVIEETQTYDNFEGKKSLYYVSKSGTLDTSAAIPSPNKINPKGKCAKYVRNSKVKFDNIKMNFNGKLSDVSNYATYSGNPAKIKMKIYTTAPVGTLIELQLGRRGSAVYPMSINSQYQAYTTVRNTWEEVEFKFSQVPQESETSTSDIDQITLLFNPNTSTSDTYFFDDLTGPPLITEKSASR